MEKNKTSLLKKIAIVVAVVIIAYFIFSATQKDKSNKDETISATNAILEEAKQSMSGFIMGASCLDENCTDIRIGLSYLPADFGTTEEVAKGRLLQISMAQKQSKNVSLKVLVDREIKADCYKYYDQPIVCN